MEYGSVDYFKDVLLNSNGSKNPDLMPHCLIGAMQGVLNIGSQPPSKILRHAKNLMQAYEEVNATLRK
ncbi:hypothetical protein ABU162_04330 [Paenibacillus thiaminolyticus]|uniref:hypothetical protein n=1 Tax=Paenibacillus thiaminolyticus TaxID=49283 RepID=UPI0035A62EFB